jgi:hypothetical protein
MKFQFDVEGPAMIEAPDEDAKKFMDQANRGAGNKAAEDAAQGEDEKVPEPATVKKVAAKPTKNSNLFSQDEEEAMEKEYQRHLADQGGVEPPDFG